MKWLRSLSSVLSAWHRSNDGGEEAGHIGQQGLGLSTKLLLLTIAFVMLAEVLIFVPSVANFRIVWLVDRLSAARIAALAADASPGGVVPTPVKQELLESVKVQSVAIKLNNMRQLVLPPDNPLRIDRHYDLRSMSDGSGPGLIERLGLISDALSVFVAPRGRNILVLGHPVASAGDFGRDDFVEITMPEEPLRAAMIQFGLNILFLSIIISVITAAMIYLALNRLLVRPIGELSGSMLHFAERPEDPARLIEPTGRSDEIGTAEKELRRLQQELQQLLKQKDRLAQLGLAVSKINHDLRNMLASAQLMSDRLTSVDDPNVQRFAPKLIASLDRAIALCNATLKFGRAEEAAPHREMFGLAELVGEVGEGLGLPRDGIDWRIEIDSRLLVDADRDQLYRVLNNLVRNAVQALESLEPGRERRIRVRGEREAGRVRITVSDTGPGLPEKARERLFRPFQGAVRRGGTGLGLVVARELVDALGGRLSVLEPEQGAAFLIEIPDRTIGRSS